MSIITYGMLWQWISSGSQGIAMLRQRYTSFILDEFAPASSGNAYENILPPDIAEMALILGQLVAQEEGDQKRLVVTSAGLRQEHVEQLFGEQAGFVAVHARRYSLHRYIVAPRAENELLDLCAEMIITAVMNQTGHVIAFLPSMY